MSRFTIKDYSLIRREWDKLYAAAQGRCRSEEELSVVKKAFDFANSAHKNVRRRSGEPYIIHPIQVAGIVVKEIGLGYKSISAALLHDVVEDTEYSIDNIRDLFGDRIALLVDGLTKIKTVLDNEDRKHGAMTSSESIQAENLKRILLTLNDDVRVVLIKLADRLHNCRTIEFMPEHKRDKILSETMFIFIPLAHRLGLYGVKSEMENIWLRFKEPDAYRQISERVNRNVAERSREIDAFVANIEGALKRADIPFTIKKRIKTPYSVWFKMRTKQVPFEQIFDLYAVRIVFEPTSNDHETEMQQAYFIYTVLLGLYTSQQSRFRDWISTPKNNGYEALHCTLMSQAGFWVEVQIRSRRMDDIAEKGIAAHWAYKNDGYISEMNSEMDKWLRKVQEIISSEDVNAIELLDIVHQDLVSTDIVVFTPTGEQRTIQNGATALDFAYSIHSHIGNQAIAAKVNMKLVPLSYVLKAGDQVEIISAGSGHPKVEWLKFLKTRHARNLVIDYLRGRRKPIAEDGKRLFTEIMDSLGVQANNANVRKLLRKTGLPDRSELFFKIGLGLVDESHFRSAFFVPANLPSGQYVTADCCHPIPGDPVIGFREEDGTVTIHKKSCPKVELLSAEYGSNRFVVIGDQLFGAEDYRVRISLRGIDRRGLLNELTQYISLTMGVNMKEIHLGSKDGVFEGSIDLLVRDKERVETMIRGINEIKGIQDVIRTDIV